MKTLQVALAQIAPVWLNKKKTLDKIKEAMLQAAKEKAQLLVFGEGDLLLGTHHFFFFSSIVCGPVLLSLFTED